MQGGYDLDGTTEGTGTDFEGSESFLSTSATSVVAAPKPSPTKKGKGSKHTQGFCNVCTLLSVKGKLQCKPHVAVVKHIVENLTEASARGDEAMGEKLQQFNDLRENAPAAPPSEFASYVLDWEEKFPAPGKGKKRACNQCDAMQIHERHIAKTSVEKGIRLVLMHQDGFVFRDRVFIQKYVNYYIQYDLHQF